MNLPVLIILISFLIRVRGVNASYSSNASAVKRPARSANNRMINGRPTDPDWYSNSAYIFYKYYVNGNNKTEPQFLKCSGMLIAPKFVLTVAHCFDKPIAEKPRQGWTMLSWHVDRDIGWVRIGSGKGGPRYKYTFEMGDIATVYICDSYRHRDVSYDADVALVELEHGIALRTNPEPLRIDNTLDPYQNVDGKVDACWAVGFGQTSLEDRDTITSKTDTPRDLYRYPLKVGTWKHCVHLQQQLDGTNRKYDRAYVCGREEWSDQPGAACEGDEGGALVCDRKLTGLLTERREVEKCAGANAFSVFVYVGHDYVYNWIKKVVGVEDMPAVHTGRVMVKSDDGDGGSADNEKGAAEATMGCRTTALVTVVVALAVTEL